MADRMREYKFKGRDSESARNRRRENAVELRKNKKAEQMMKRRNVVTEDVKPLGEASSNNSKAITLLELPQICTGMLTSTDPQTQFQAVQSCRKLLSKEKVPPVENIIQNGLVPKLVEFLGRNEYPELQYEAAWALTNIASGTSDQTRVVVQAGAVPYLIKMLSSNDDSVQDQAVWCIGNIAGDGPDLRDMILAAGILQPLLTMLHSPIKLELKRNATWVLSNLCRGKNPQPSFEMLQPAIPTLIQLIHDEDDDTVGDALWAVSYLSDGDARKIQALVDSGALPRLVAMLSRPVVKLQMPAVRALGNIATGTDEQTQSVVDAGALGSMHNLLTSAKETLRKEACWFLSNITAGTQEQIQALLEAQLAPLIIKCLEDGEFRTRKEASWALSNLTTEGTPEQISYIVGEGCVAPLVDMLDCHDTKIIGVVLDALSNILKVAEAFKNDEGENPAAIFIEEADGIEAIELLQESESEEVYEKALFIIETYFQDEGDDDDVVQPGAAENAFTFVEGNAVTAGGFSF
eukprot:TRINITY_DN27111_c0_g1_i1.p1 TRINITY_DN27111_c0_g1~~TRINITY_DN27111_c0_g1_i1.p1  ORF type:complete len:521 (+),score=188.92 TRINITY_DN27111_c0_g1_i1:56-1618(+)